MRSLADVIGPVRHSLDRLRRNHRARVAEFLDRYPDGCVECFDAGVWGADACPHCEKGRAVAAQRRAAEAKLLVAQAGLAPFAGRTLENWPLGADPDDATDRADVLSMAESWLTAFRAQLPDEPWLPGLFLCGAAGNGKSSLAAALLRAMIERHCRAGLRITEGEFFARLKPGPDQDNGLRFRAHRVPFLVIDDLGTEKETAFVEGERFGLINARYEARRWTAITTNYPFDHPDFRASVGQRVHDRLGEMCHIVTVPGDSLRGRGGRY